MEIGLQLLQDYGFPLALCIFLLWYLAKTQRYVQETQEKEARENAERIEKIIITLINNSKRNEMLLNNIKGSISTMINIYTKLNKEK